MQKQDRKARVQQLENDLAKSTSPEVLFVRELLKLKFEEAKDRLVDAVGDDVFKIQGEAKCLDGMFKKLTAPPAPQQRVQGV
jgi:hypothetical protein